MTQDKQGLANELSQVVHDLRVLEVAEVTQELSYAALQKHAEHLAGYRRVVCEALDSASLPAITVTVLEQLKGVMSAHLAGAITEMTLRKEYSKEEFGVLAPNVFSKDNQDGGD